LRRRLITSKPATMINVTITEEGGTGFDEADILREIAEDVASQIRESASDLSCPVHGSDGFVRVQVTGSSVEIRTCCEELDKLLPEIE